jgi:hypothetical protein
MVKMKQKNNTKKSTYGPIGMIKQNGLIQEDYDVDDDDYDDDDDDDVQATCSNCYNFNNYMTNM